MKIIQITLAALLVVAVAAIAGIGQPEPAGGAADEPKDGITVTGTGQVSAVPDEAEFSLGVTNLADRNHYTQAFACVAGRPSAIYPEPGRAFTAAVRVRF